MASLSPPVEAEVKRGDRVLIGPLGVYGTVECDHGDGRVAVMADCASQVVIWNERELEVVT